jgi:NAD+ kinase
VTASKFPFPTVCADKQSTDWFHAISRTLKWNERERQKSFVVVEESPRGRKNRTEKHSATAKLDRPRQSEKELLKEAVEEALDEEDEVTDDEDVKFDIDDSSPEAASNTNLENDRHKDVAIETELTSEVASDGQHTESTHTHGKPSTRVRTTRSKSRQRAPSASDSGSDAHSGVNSPGRYAGSKYHPPSGRLVASLTSGDSSSSDSSSSSVVSTPTDLARYGARDDIHSPISAHSSGRSQIPKDRDLDEERISRTPTNADSTRKGNRSGSSSDHHPRAFAVWGLDESDSAASSDSGM